MKTYDEIWVHACHVISELTNKKYDSDTMCKMVRIYDLGLDSLQYAQVMLSLELFTGKPVDENKVNWAELDTIDKLIGIFL